MLVAVSPLVFRGLAMVAMAAIGQALPGVGISGGSAGSQRSAWRASRS
jgi:hypothetical protein